MWQNTLAESIKPPAAYPFGIRMTDWLRENLEKSLALPAPATDWLMMLYGAIQVFDDVADGDVVKRQDLNATIWNTLVGMSRNIFWLENAQTLTPVVATMILKWQASAKHILK